MVTSQHCSVRAFRLYLVQEEADGRTESVSGGFLGSGMNKLNQKLVKRPDLLKIMYTHRERHTYTNTHSNARARPQISFSAQYPFHMTTIITLMPGRKLT